MILDEALLVLRKIIDDELQPRLTKCYEFGESVDGDDGLRQRLKKKYDELDAELMRASVCTLILQGSAFTFDDKVTGLTIVLPKRQEMADLVKKSEDNGGRVTSVEHKEKGVDNKKGELRGMKRNRDDKPSPPRLL